MIPNSGRGLPLGHLHLAEHDDPVGAVDRDPVALVDDGVAHRERGPRDPHRLGADHRRLPPAPRDHGGVADQAAPGGEDPFGGQHAVHVLGGGLGADQHHPLTPLGRGLGVVGGEVDPADGGPGRRPQAPGQHRVAGSGELGMEDLVEVVGGDPSQRLLLGQLDGLLPDHVDGHLEGGPPGALAHPGLQHPQLALLDGELGVAHVPVVRLQAVEDGEQLLVDLGELVLQRRQRLGVADAGHHVLALGVDQEVAVLAGGAGGRITGEADAGPRGVVAVAEHHGLHIDGGAEVVGDPLPHPVGDGPGAVPRGEDRLDGPAQLIVGILGEGLAGVALHDLLVGVDQVAEEQDGDTGIR